MRVVEVSNNVDKYKRGFSTSYLGEVVKGRKKFYDKYTTIWDFRALSYILVGHIITYRKELKASDNYFYLNYVYRRRIRYEIELFDVYINNVKMVDSFWSTSVMNVFEKEIEDPTKTIKIERVEYLLLR